MKPFSETRPGRDGWLIAVLVLAALLRLLGLRFGLPDKLYFDEFALVNHALGFGKGDLNPHWFEYPSLQMYVLFAVYGLVFAVGRLTGAWHGGWDFAVAYFRDPTLLQTISRGVTVLYAVLSVWLLYHIVRRWWGRAAALAAALVLAVSPMHVINSHYVTTDVPMICMALLALWLAQCALDGGSRRKLFLAAFVAGLAGAAKYPGLAMVPVVAAAPFLFPRVGLKRRVLDAVGLALTGLAGFAAGAPFTFLDWRAFRAGMAFQSNLVGKVGHLGFEASRNGWLFHARHSLPEIMSWALILLALLGLLLALRRAPARTVWLCLFPAAVFAVIGSQKTLFSRYALPLAPFLALFCGVAYSRLLSWRHSSLWRTALATVLLAACAPMALDSLGFGLSNSFPDTRSVARRWIEGQLPPGSAVALSRNSAPLTPDEASLSHASERVGGRLAAMGASSGAHLKSREKFKLLNKANESKTRFDVYGLDGYWRPGTLDWLVARGVGYAAVDGAMEYRYRQAARYHPDEVEFFDEVKERGVLLHRVSPQPIRFSGLAAPFNGLRLVNPGPEISIYRLPANRKDTN